MASKYYIEGSVVLEFDKQHNREIRKEGFTPNDEYNCYIVEDYGAFMGNVENIDDINNEYYNEYKDEGYELVLGPSSNDFYKYGVFCKNYDDIAMLMPTENIDDDEEEFNELIQELTSVLENHPNIVGDFNIYQNTNYDDYNNFLDDTKSNKVNLEDIDVNGIIDRIKRKITGQDEAIETIVSNIYANQVLINSGNPDLIATEKAAILVDGPTGTGKTAIMKEIAREFSLPIVITSATRYSQTGYVGDSLDSILQKLIELADGDMSLAERGIVCFDEIDKLGHGVTAISGENMRESVQEEILSYMSGEKIIVDSLFDNVEFDTTNLTFIGMGAFTSLRERKINAKNKLPSTMGFNAPITKKEKERALAKIKKDYTITDQDYVEYGLKRELIGRFTLQTYTRAYSVEDYKTILKESELSPLKQFEEFAKTLNIDEVNYDEEFIEQIAKQAYDDNFGARGLQKIISDLKNILLLDMINSKSKSINLTTEMLEKRKEKTIRKY